MLYLDLYFFALGILHEVLTRDDFAWMDYEGQEL